MDIDFLVDGGVLAACIRNRIGTGNVDFTADRGVAFGRSDDQVVRVGGAVVGNGDRSVQLVHHRDQSGVGRSCRIRGADVGGAGTGQGGVRNRTCHYRSRLIATGEGNEGLRGYCHATAVGDGVSTCHAPAAVAADDFFVVGDVAFRHGAATAVHKEGSHLCVGREVHIGAVAAVDVVRTRRPRAGEYRCGLVGDGEVFRNRHCATVSVRNHDRRRVGRAAVVGRGLSHGGSVSIHIRCVAPCVVIWSGTLCHSHRDIVSALVRARCHRHGHRSLRQCRDGHIDRHRGGVVAAVGHRDFHRQSLGRIRQRDGRSLCGRLGHNQTCTGGAVVVGQVADVRAEIRISVSTVRRSQCHRVVVAVGHRRIFRIL